MPNFFQINGRELPEDPKVKAKLAEIDQVKAKEHQLWRELVALVDAIQNTCPHEKMTEIREYGHLYKLGVQIEDEKELASKFCPDCKLSIKRPEGKPWQICHICWGEMKYAGIIPGQGGRTHVYECAKCGHQVEIA